MVEKKWVFNGSAGWLLFWLIVAPPIGYLWLIFDMERGEIKEDKSKILQRKNRTFKE